MNAEQGEAVPLEPAVEGLVSVIAPTHNRAELVLETLDSVAAQTHRPIELIVVDDGSTDDTAAAVERWRSAHADADLHVIYERQPHSGAGAARNRGLRRSRGRYIQFLDSDDLLTAAKLERSLEAMAKHNVSVVVTDAQRFADDDQERRKPTLFSQRSPRDVLGHAHKGLMNTPTGLYRREAVRAMGPWREDLAVWQDFEFTFRAFAMRLPIAWIDEVGVLIRNTADSIIRQHPDDTCGSYIQACECVEATAAEHGLLTARLRAALGRRLMKRSKISFARGAPTAGRRLYREALPRLSRLRRYEAMLHHAVRSVRKRRSPAPAASR